MSGYHDDVKMKKNTFYHILLKTANVDVLQYFDHNLRALLVVVFS